MMMRKNNKLALLLGFGLATVNSFAKAWDHVSSPAELSRIIVEELTELQRPVLVAFVKGDDDPATAALETEWQAAASAARPDQNLFSVDCSITKGGSESEFDDGCRIQKDMPPFPSIWLMEKDRPLVQYRGARRSDAFLHFLDRNSRPSSPSSSSPVKEIITAEELNSFKVADETVFIAYLNNKKKNQSQETKKGEEEEIDQSRGAFEDVARKYGDEFSFGVVSEREVAESQVVAYKMVDGDTVTWKGEIKDADEFERWLREASRPVISELTVMNRERLIERGWPMVYLFGSTEAERQKLRKNLYKFARSYYDSLTTVIVNPSDFPDLMGQLGLDPTVTPAGAVHQLSKDRIYPYPKGKAFSPDAVQSWGMDIYNGRIKPWNPSPGAATTTAAAAVSDERAANPTKKTATRKISMANIPGVNIKIAGRNRDEL